MICLVGDIINRLASSSTCTGSENNLNIKKQINICISKLYVDLKNFTWILLISTVCKIKIKTTYNTQLRELVFVMLRRCHYFSMKATYHDLRYIVPALLCRACLPACLPITSFSFTPKKIISGHAMCTCGVTVHPFVE